MAAGSASSPVETWSDSPAPSGEVWKDSAPIKPPGSHGAIGEFYSKLALAHPIDAISGAAHAIAHPLDTFAAISHQTGDLARKAQESYRQGDYGGAAAHAFNAALNVIPGLGAALDEAATKGANGDWSGMVADAGALAANIATPKLLGKAGVAVKAGASTVAEVAPSVARGALETASQPGVGAAVGSAVGALGGHPIAGALAGLKASEYAGRLLKAMAKPAEAEEAAEEVSASKIIKPDYEESAPRSPERQAIVDELNRQPGKVAQPSNTVTTPASAENASTISAPEATNRSKLAQEMAAKLHEAGAEWDQARRLSPGDAFWKTLRSTVRNDAKQPSPATVQLALEHLKDLEAKAGMPAKVVPITSAPTALKGKAADIARQLSEEMAK